MSGILAAFAARRAGLLAALVIGDNPLGGMPANGISRADVSTTRFVGGLARTFYGRIGAHYGEDYCFCYEPHVAYGIGDSFVKEAGFDVYASSLLRVDKAGSTITGIKLLDGTPLFAAYFIDASYEGDLMAGAGVRYTVGRESRVHYGESLAGFGAGQIDTGAPARQSDGRLYWGVIEDPATAEGDADHRVMAYCYRLCVTNDASNRLPYPEPPDYVADRYLLRLERIGKHEVYERAGTPLPNGKFDVNGGGLMDCDFISGSWGYADGNAATRQKIIDAHYRYHTGLLYFLCNDPRVPESYRASFAAYGLAADEFTHNGGWPGQLYIRAGRRMVGRYVLREQDVAKGASQPDPIGVAVNNFDCHPVMRFPNADDKVILEGGLSRMDGKTHPYQIPYRSITPHPTEARNLLVTVCISASHIAYCSIRLEHHFMIMGEAAGVAVGLALEHGTSVQDVSPSALAKELERRGVILAN